MKQCTVKHRSAATRANCPICGRKTPVRKRAAQVSRVEQQTADSMQLMMGSTGRDFRDRWRKRDITGIMRLMDDSTIRSGTNPHINDNMAKDWYSAANLYNYTLDDAIRKYGEGSMMVQNWSMEERRDKLLDTFTPLDGFVTRGVKTDGDFTTVKELDDHVESLAESGKQMLFRKVPGYPIRDDAILSCSSSPVIAGMFAKGANIVTPTEVSKVMERTKGTRSGYLTMMSDVDGAVMPDASHMGNYSEKEVLVAANDLELTDFIPSRKSGFGMPVLVYSGR